MGKLLDDLKEYYVPHWTLLIVCFLSGFDQRDTLLIITVLFLFSVCLFHFHSHKYVSNEKTVRESASPFPV